MYTATTRATYAELFKAAAAAIPGRLPGTVIKVASTHPLLAAALTRGTR